MIRNRDEGRNGRRCSRCSGTAVDYAATQVGMEHVGAVGFCWGGSLAWLAATRLTVAVAVGYYGGRIAEYVHEKPRCPVVLHFVVKDAHISASEINRNT